MFTSIRQLCNFDTTHYLISPPSAFPPIALPYNTTRVTVLPPLALRCTPPSRVTVLPHIALRDHLSLRITTPCVTRLSKSTFDPNNYFLARYTC
ncbi:hypothetical protein RHMOL_Rhmol02G0118600 [Rhododendron molle]|uniref:Uncharacterized protein n=1 Tax=Rhododendron molle TaxID=49168 RepID=A0ACC0PQG9_RHOML|nr:hypothetical protein RHMOL_Rhmol02G0118600 [Rhododendron molle]